MTTYNQTIDTSYFQATREKDYQISSTEIQICEVEAVTKLRGHNSVAGVNYGVKLKDIKTRREFWINVYRNEVTLKWGMTVKVKGTCILSVLSKKA